jgi:Domain of unknown function (DUF4129)
MKKLIVFILLHCCLTSGNLVAQDTTIEEIVQPPAEEINEAEADEAEISDTALISSVTTFSNDSILSYKKQKEFSYIHKLDSLLKANQDEALRKQKKKPAVEFVNPFPLLRLILWGLAIAVVVFVVYRLFLGKDGLFAAPVKNKKLEIQEEELTDETYIDQQLKQAIAVGNYRLAIRFLYLQTLSKLADKGWLQLSPDKTNYQYVKELTQKDLKNEFALITLHYEYAWYGDFAIGQEIFNPVQNEFENFQNRVKRA